jgi:hypothetical protein
MMGAQPVSAGRHSHCLQAACVCPCAWQRPCQVVATKVPAEQGHALLCQMMPGDRCHSDRHDVLCVPVWACLPCARSAHLRLECSCRCSCRAKQVLAVSRACNDAAALLLTVAACFDQSALWHTRELRRMCGIHHKSHWSLGTVHSHMLQLPHAHPGLW